jgi:putative salt-induced outer membrane protein YdiY
VGYTDHEEPITVELDDGQRVRGMSQSASPNRLRLEMQKDETPSEINMLAFGRYSYFLTPQWFLYTQGLFEYDKFADLDLRSTIGVGPGYQFFASKDLNLSMSAGPRVGGREFR